ncbi:MAG: ThuA domain-containing protein [Planctomycetes bacterium]|nr:ThuA domain-containing protein [Planctomycetota bacterium]
MLIPLTAASMNQPHDLWVTYDGQDGPGKDLHIVLISGDEEYRSEEALPQLGKILATRHGFTCTVLFAIDEKTGIINPENRHNIPGLESLATADLVIIATRFRDLPDEQMAYIDQYLKEGKPIIGMRTATHAFALNSSSTYQHYNWNSADPKFEQGFGRQILGETWINHHGHHGHESTRGIVVEDQRDHAIVRGISEKTIWGPTDVYGVRLPLAGDAQPIVLGQVLAGMSPDDEPVTGEKNTPMMPIGWTKTYQVVDGKRGRVFTTTMGAATDLLAEGTRRMIVNAVYWALSLEEKLPQAGADVRIVGTFKPIDFGFAKHRQGVRPADHAIKAKDTP